MSQYSGSLPEGPPVPATGPRPPKNKKPPHPFRRAVLRGLGVILPPLLTIVLFLWAWNIIEVYVLTPLESAARHAIVQWEWDVLNQKPPEDEITENPAEIESFLHGNRVYVALPGGKYIPKEVYDAVLANPGDELPKTAREYFHRYVKIRWLRRTIVVPVFLGIFILVLYLIGKMLAARAGLLLWTFFEGLIHRVPIIRNVYGSVKQVTDFVFSEQEVEYTRVVAVQYPRRGIWSVGFITGESMLDIRSAANEPVVSVLMPTSPMPATGFTITVLKSETVDLDISIDQAIQFMVSCGVVVPAHQQAKASDLSAQISATITGHQRLEGSSDESGTDVSKSESRKDGIRSGKSETDSNTPGPNDKNSE